MKLLVLGLVAACLVFGGWSIWHQHAQHTAKRAADEQYRLHEQKVQREEAIEKQYKEEEDEQHVKEMKKNVQLSIESDGRFAICRVRHLEFHNVSSQGCNLPSPYCDNMSPSSEDSELKLLSDAGYIGGHGHPITTQYSTGVHYWTPNVKGEKAIGTEIRQKKIAEWTNGEVAYDWTLILGCRKFQQIDATTNLSDGLKVDFSWGWEPTKLGIADGFSTKRQRGVAYLTQTSNGLTIDHIQMDSER